MFRLPFAGFALLLACIGSTLAQTPEEAEALLKRLDANGDGVISPSEVPARTQITLNRIAQKAGMSPNGSLTISKVIDKMRGGDGDDRREDDRRDDDRRREDDRGRWDRSRWGDRDRDDDRDRDRDRDDSPAVPGFGEEVSLIGPPGFGADADLAYVSIEDRYEDRVIEYADKILDRYDKDDNEILDAQEIKQARWSSDPSESDLNNDGVLTKAELCERIAVRHGGRKEPEESGSASGRGSGSRSSGSSRSSGGDSDRYRKYAEALIKQNDKNDNGVLEKEEWENVRVAQGADVSKDGVVTAAELTAKLSGYGGGSSSASSSSESRSSDRDSRDSRDSRSRSRFGGWNRDRDRGDRDDDDDKPSIRFLTPTERLPRGLPDWFLEADRDGNQDGQVHLSEYEDSASKFSEYDLNNDGFITPKECLAAAESRAR